MNYKPSLWLLALTTALISCQKEPDWAEQSNEYLVYTQKDASFEAGRYENYFIADSILLIDDVEEPRYLKGTEAEKIISRVALNMERAGYHRTDRKKEGSKLNVVWNMYINGEVSGYRHFDSNRMQRGIDQAFHQSRYLNRNTNP